MTCTAAAIEEAETGAACGAIDPRQRKMQRFLRWMEEQGANFPSLELEDRAGVRIVRAAGPMAAGELAMHIPRSLFITLEVMKASRIGCLIAACAGEGEEIDDLIYMAAFLIDEKRRGGFWKPYTDVLPEGFPEHPSLYSEAELDYLKGVYCLPLIRRLREALAAQYERVRSCLPQEEAFTFDEFAWGRCAATTRAFMLTVDERKLMTLVPLADMLDHAGDRRSAVWSTESSNGFLYTTARELQAGDALCCSYGKKCNGILFLGHGFCVEDNPHNQAEIELPELPQDHPRFAQSRNLGIVRGAARVLKVQEKYDTPAMRAAFSYLRLGFLEDPTHPAPADGDEPDHVPPLSRENETAALAALLAACENRLAQFDTSIEQDEALLEGGTLPRKLHYAVMLRRDEKVILKHLADLAKTAMPILRDPSCDLAGYAAAENRFADYFGEIARHLGGGTIIDR